MDLAEVRRSQGYHVLVGVGLGIGLLGRRGVRAALAVEPQTAQEITCPGVEVPGQDLARRQPVRDPVRAPSGAPVLHGGRVDFMVLHAGASGRL